MNSATYVDVHCHMTDPRSEPFLESWIREAKEINIGFFLQGGIGPEDWERQKQLSLRYPGQIGLCFGLHPYWVIDHEEEDCESALDLLVTQLPGAMILGEIGLDFRPHIMKNSRERQITLFEMQLEIAEAIQKPVVLHLVQAHDEALRILDLWGVPKRGGFVHSFNGSTHQLKEFLGRGLSVSVGGPLLRSDNEKLRQSVRECPLESLLIETDSPDQSPKGKGDLNPLTSLLAVAKEVGRLKEISSFDVLEASRENLQRLLKMELP